MAFFMQAQTGMSAQEWTFSDNVLPNARVIEIAVTSGGAVVSSAIEEGSFVSYNKTTEPLEVSASLGYQGTDPELQGVLTNLARLKDAVQTFSVVTPVAEYENMTLQDYDYALRREDGRGALYVNARFVEIRETALTYTDSELPPITETQTEDASACVKEDIGLQQAQAPDLEERTAAENTTGRSSVLYDLFG